MSVSCLHCDTFVLAWVYHAIYLKKIAYTPPGLTCRCWHLPRPPAKGSKAALTRREIVLDRFETAIEAASADQVHRAARRGRRHEGTPYHRVLGRGFLISR